MIIINPIIFSFARLRAIKKGHISLAKYIENLIFEDLKQNDSELFDSFLDAPKNKQTLTDSFSDLENEEILPFGLAKKMSKIDHLNEVNLIESFIDLTEGGTKPEHPYNNRWRDFYCAQQFLLEKKVYNRYMLAAKFAGENARRFVNIIIKEWLTAKRIEEQDRIEREAHGGS